MTINETLKPRERFLGTTPQDILTRSKILQDLMEHIANPANPNHATIRVLFRKGFDVIADALGNYKLSYFP